MDLTKHINPKNTILLVIDKQAGYFDPVLVGERNMSLPENSVEILENIDRFIEDARKNNVEVVWTQMVEDAEDSPKVTSELMKADPGGIRSISKPGTRSFDIYGRVKPLPREKILTKYYYNAFAKTDLSEHLIARNITTVILVGGYAPRCILSTAVGANSDDLFVVIVNDAVTYQVNTKREIPGLFFFVDSLLGSAPSSREITETWKTKYPLKL